MTIWLVIALTLLTHTAFKGSRVVISLYAIQFGATPFEIATMAVVVEGTIEVASRQEWSIHYSFAR